MLVINKQIDISNFKICVNQNLINITDNVKYLGIHVDDKLSWKTHINNLCFKLSKLSGIIFKLRHFVPLSSFRLVYYAMFHSHIQIRNFIGVGPPKVTLTNFQLFKTKYSKLVSSVLCTPQQIIYTPSVEC